MKNNNRYGAALVTGLVTIVVAFTLGILPNSAFASGGGGGTQALANFSGNWSGTITTSFGTGLFTMAISESSSGNLSGSAHFGAPIFDSTLKLSAFSPDNISFTGYVLKSKGGLPITGTLSADGSTISGTVVELGETFTYIVLRN